MPRKKRVLITGELNAIIIRMHQNENKSVIEMANSLNMCQRTVKNLLKKHSEGNTFVSVSEK
jgi:hypothetical protein